MQPTQSHETGPNLHFRDGLRWIGEAWTLLMARPGNWVLFGLVTVLITVLASLVPFVGLLAGFLLSPMLGASYVLTATLQENGRETRVENVFLGFQHRTNQLALVGTIQLLLFIGTFALSLLVALLAGGLFTLVDRATFRGELEAVVQSLTAASNEIDAGMMAAQAGTPALLTIGFLALSVWLVAGAIATMMGWFAPALVVLREMDAWPAMKASLRACLTRIWPMLGFSVGLFGMALILVLTLGVGILVTTPWVQLSTYAAFKALFPSSTHAPIPPETL